MMEHTYKYITKYSNLTPEERRNIKNENYRKWYNSLDEERKSKYTEIKKNYAKKYLNNYKQCLCEVCNKQYADIYQHYKTKTHNEKVLKSPELTHNNSLNQIMLHQLMKK